MITLDHVNKNSGNFLPTLWLVDKYKQYPNCVSVICNLEQKKLNENKFLKRFKEKFANFCIWEDNVIGVKPEVSEEVLEELGKPEASKGMTLADIYNLDVQSYEHKTRRKIGF